MHLLRLNPVKAWNSPGQRWPSLPGSFLHRWAVHLVKRLLFISSLSLPYFNLCHCLLPSHHTPLWRAWLCLLYPLLSPPVGSGDAPEALSSGWTSHGATASPCWKRAPNPPSQWSPLNPPQTVNVYTYCIHCVSSTYSICFPNTSGFLEWNILFLKPNCLLRQEENSSRLSVFKAIGHKTMDEKVPRTDNMLPKMSNNYLCKGLLRPCFRRFIVLCLVLFKMISKSEVNLCKMQKKGPRCQK